MNYRPRPVDASSFVEINFKGKTLFSTCFFAQFLSLVTIAADEQDEPRVLRAGNLLRRRLQDL